MSAVLNHIWGLPKYESIFRSVEYWPNANWDLGYVRGRPVPPSHEIRAWHPETSHRLDGWVAGSFTQYRRVFQPNVNPTLMPNSLFSLWCYHATRVRSRLCHVRSKFKATSLIQTWAGVSHISGHWIDPHEKCQEYDTGIMVSTIPNERVKVMVEKDHKQDIVHWQGNSYPTTVA